MIELSEAKRFIVRHEVYNETEQVHKVETHTIKADKIVSITPGVIALTNTEDDSTLLVDADFFQAGWTEGVE